MKSEIHVCVVGTQNDTCDVFSLQQALDQVAPAGTVILHPGEYRQAAFVRQNGILIKARPGARLFGTAVGGKGAFVVQANDVVIEGLACSGIAVRDGNGACVRLEGTNLTLRRVHFFDSQEGVLAGNKNSGKVLIEDSRFENLGARRGRSHGIYVGSGELIIRRSVFISSKDEGHEIKSRAARTIIEDSVVASLNGQDSYLIDLSNGGEAIIRRNILQEGPKSVNKHAITFALEGDRHENSHILIEDNIILMERTNGVIVFSRAHKATFRRNLVVGNPGSYAFGPVDNACERSGNKCVTTNKEARSATSFLRPQIDGLDAILAEIGLLR